jgi:hypothetical protein
VGYEVGVDHLAAADRHETAAKSHDRAARFWHDQGDAQRAELQHEMAEFERHGAVLERRWAELAEWDGVDRSTAPGERVIDHTRRGAKPLSGVLTRMADALDRTASLADEHAIRREKAGRSDDAAAEREAAKRARTAAQRARSQAAQWLETHHGNDG